jgi:23S rRNA (adenine-N6)-dimethyltransferase
VQSGDLVLDLGAGLGALTEPLVLAGATVIAVELNPWRAAVLRERCALYPVTVVCTDVLRLRFPRRRFRVVASPPYNLSTAVLTRLLSTDRLLSADLVLQTAAVRRLVDAPPGARHAHAYRVERGIGVPRRAFTPAPAVDSAVLRIRRRTDPV